MKEGITLSGDYAGQNIGVHIVVDDPGEFAEVDMTFRKWGFDLVDQDLVSYKMEMPVPSGDGIEDVEVDEHFLILNYEHEFLTDWSQIPQLIGYLEVDGWLATDQHVPRLLMVKMPPNYGEDIMEIITKLRVFTPKLDFDWF